MKFVIHGLGLTTGGGKVGALNLLPALARHNQHEFVAVLPDLPEFEELRTPNLQVILNSKPRSLAAREALLNFWLPRICRKEKADGLLCLGNFAPHRPPVPTVLFLQNAYYVCRDPLAYQGLTFREKMVVRYGWHHLRHLPENITVVVQTENMRKHLTSRFPVPHSRIEIIPDGGDSIVDSPVAASSRAKNSAEPFTFLCLAVYSPNKNLEVLVDAVKQVKDHTRRSFRCLITIDPNQHPGVRRLLRRVAREKVADVLTNIGPVPFETLSSIYRSADAFLLPTLLESFGRPYTEAMRFGLPILTSDRDFARERCQDAAIYFDPLKAGSVAEVMIRVIEDDQLRQGLAEGGRRLAEAMPTREETAARFVQALERVATERIMHSSEPLLAEAPDPVHT